MPRISAIIVTYNSRREIGRCLASLQRSSLAINQVIVIDNDSSDGTADYVRREFPDALLLDFWDNPGFGEGNNRGARVASGDYLLLLNPDATVAANCIERLASVLERDRQIGIAVPKVVLASEPSIINSAGLNVNAVGYGWDRGYLEWDIGQYDRSEPVIGGSGCALMVRAGVFRELGGFDSRYFLYYEDLDLCWRSWIMGHPVQYVPSAVAHHAMKVYGRPALYDEYMDHRNRLRTLLKNLSGLSLLRAAPRLVMFEARSVVRRARGRQWQNLRRRLQAWNWNLLGLPDTLARRRAVQRRRVVRDDMLQSLFVSGSTPNIRASSPGYPETYDGLVDCSRLSPAIVMGSNDAGALGLGWYGLESFDGLPARWCCGYGIAFLGAHGRRESVLLRIRCVASRPTEVTVRTDRLERNRFVVNAGRWQEIEAKVPLNGEFLRVELLVDPTFVPCERDPASPDCRTLGVAVASIGLTPEDAGAR